MKYDEALDLDEYKQFKKINQLLKKTFITEEELKILNENLKNKKIRKMLEGRFKL